MVENIEELKKMRCLFEQKKKAFQLAISHHMLCIKKIEQLHINRSEIAGTRMINLFNMLDSKLLLATYRLTTSNKCLKQCSSVEMFNNYVNLFNIKNIDRDLLNAYIIYNKFYQQCSSRGLVNQECLDSMQQTNFIVMKLYGASIDQLQLCIDFIDKTISNEQNLTTDTDLQK